MKFYNYLEEHIYFLIFSVSMTPVHESSESESSDEDTFKPLLKAFEVSLILMSNTLKIIFRITRGKVG